MSLTRDFKETIINRVKSERIWGNLAVAVTPEFINGYRRRYVVTGPETGTAHVMCPGLFETPSVYGKPVLQQPPPTQPRCRCLKP